MNPPEYDLLLDAHYHVLRSDLVVQTLVGVDADNEVKVYDTIVKTGAKAPYIYIQHIPILSDNTGVYGDIDVLKISNFQVACWAKSSKKAKQLFNAANNALFTGDWNSHPWELMQLTMDGLPIPGGDRDTDLVQVQARYRAMFGR